MTASPQLAVSYTEKKYQAAAQAFADQYHFPLAATPQSDFDYVLLIGETVTLNYRIKNKTHCFYLDFTSAKWLTRLKNASRKQELLIKAMGSLSRHTTLIDATAGFGRDSLVLAAAGFNVISIEQSPIVHILLKNAYARASTHPKIAKIISRIRLIEADALEILSTLAKVEKPAVIYLDPMFPPRQKSSLVKKEMQVLQDLLGYEESVDRLLKLALACAHSRVVVKRPRLSTIFTNIMPNYSLNGKNSKFDVYLVP